ncbi:Clr5 domain-containing protein [Apiospora rasikravindrae]|uniref:Clr5 domain-containing protein n=1 Tax=Apiospora rasikravindrae TaxID=990691 RepID=A0ABR1S0W2_9PEZI
MDPTRSGMATTMDSQSKWAKPEDWAKYKNTISALFMCHSLPNVMRIMREDHEFHATPKMYQVHIYQKWGLRKGRPEPKSNKKRRRAPTEEPEESVASSSHTNTYSNLQSNAQSNVQSNAHSNVHSSALTSAMSLDNVNQRLQLPVQDFSAPDDMEHTRALQLVEQQHAQLYDKNTWAREPISYHEGDYRLRQSPPRYIHPPEGTDEGDHLTQAGIAGYTNEHAGRLGPALRHVVAAQSQEVAPPNTWQDFIGTSHLDPANQHNTTTLPQRGAPVPSYAFSEMTDPSIDDSGTWMSTVLDQTQPSSVTASTRFSNKSAKRDSGQGPGMGSGASQASSRSRVSRGSHASSSRETLLSTGSSLSFKSKTKSNSSRSTQSRMTLPTGTIRLMASPDTLMFSEKSMFFARHYISSTFSTGLWTLSQNTDTSLLDTECVKLDAWYNDFNPGFEFLYENRSNQPDRIKRAFCIFQRCFAATEYIIEPQDPRLVIYICQQTIRFMFYDTVGRNLAQTFLRYVSGLCKKMFGESHPLYIIMSQLARMDQFEFAQNVPALMECYFDHLEPFLGEETSAFGFVNDLRGLTISIMEATGMMGLYEAKPILDRLVKRAEKLGHNRLHLMIEQAAIFQRNRYYMEARNMLRNIRNSQEGKNDPYERVYASIVLMVVFRKMRDSDAGIHLGYEMVDYIENFERRRDMPEFNYELFKGLGPSTLMIFLGKLEVELREVQRFDEADEVKAKMDQVMNSQYEYNVNQQQEGLDQNTQNTVATAA